MLQHTYLHFIEEEATNSQAGKGTDSTWGVVAGEAGWYIGVKKEVLNLQDDIVNCRLH
jgi:hypothetical protein